MAGWTDREMAGGGSRSFRLHRLGPTRAVSCLPALSSPSTLPAGSPRRTSVSQGFHDKVNGMGNDEKNLAPGALEPGPRF
jgi:hypothetical protein